MVKTKSNKSALNRELISSKYIRSILDSDYEQRFLDYLREIKMIQIFCNRVSNELNSIYLHPKTIVKRCTRPSHSRQNIIEMMIYCPLEEINISYWKTIAHSYKQWLFYQSGSTI